MTYRGLWYRYRQQLLDWAGLVGVPALSALLPWRWCFRLYRLLCSRWPLYPQTQAADLAHARQHGMASDAHEWIMHRRLVTLVDHADLYLARSRSMPWLHRHGEVKGEWPAAGQPALLLTFHWGAAMWALRHAHSEGLRPHMLLAVDEQAQGVQGWYARLRLATIERCTGRPVVPVHHARQPLTDARRRVDFDRLIHVLEAGEPLLAVIDVPFDQLGRSVEVTLAGRRARAALPLFELAARQRLPVAVFSMDVCLQTGRRSLEIECLPASDDPVALLHATFSRLDRLLRQDPVKWHFWPWANRFFTDSGPCA